MRDIASLKQSSVSPRFISPGNQIDKLFDAIIKTFDLLKRWWLLQVYKYEIVVFAKSLKYLGFWKLIPKKYQNILKQIKSKN